MAEGSEQILIDRSVGEVWSFHTEPANILRISVNTKKYIPQGPMQLGTEIHGATKVIGRTVDWIAEITEWTELRGYTLRATDSPVEWELSYSYQPSGRGTVVTARQTAFGLDGFFGRIAEPFIVRRYRKDLASNLANLKLMVESQAPLL